MSGYDNNPNSIFRASRTVKKIINKNLKKDEDAKLALQNQQMGLKPNISSNIETDVNKNFSLFSLNLKQVSILISTLVDFVNTSVVPKRYQLGLGTMSIKEINDLNPRITPEQRELLGGAKSGKKKSSGRSSSSSILTPSWHNSPPGSVIGSQIHSAPIGDSGSDTDSDIEGSVEQIDFGGDPNPDSDPDSSDSDSDSDDSDISSLSESEDPLIGREIDLNPRNEIKDKNINVNLSREIARISNSIQHLMALWEDSISPNILYLSKTKLSNFLNSNILLNFRHSLAEFKLFIAVVEQHYPNLRRIYQISLTEADELLVSIIRDIKRVSGIDSGTTMTGAGFLHFPSPYNNFVNHSKTKYLM